MSVVMLLRSRHRDLAVDESCHNSSRITAPKQFLDVAITDDEWPKLTTLLREFGAAHEWAFRDASVAIPGRLESLHLSLCAENSLNVVVSEDHWLDTHVFDHPGIGVGVLLYGSVPRDVWQPAARELFQALDSEWPGRARFRVDGTVTDERPAYLK